MKSLEFDGFGGAFGAGGVESVVLEGVCVEPSEVIDLTEGIGFEFAAVGVGIYWCEDFFVFG